MYFIEFMEPCSPYFGYAHCDAHAMTFDDSLAKAARAAGVGVMGT